MIRFFLLILALLGMGKASNAARVRGGGHEAQQPKQHHPMNRKLWSYGYSSYTNTNQGGQNQDGDATDQRNGYYGDGRLNYYNGNGDVSYYYDQDGKKQEVQYQGQDNTYGSGYYDNNGNWVSSYRQYQSGDSKDGYYNGYYGNNDNNRNSGDNGQNSGDWEQQWNYKQQQYWRDNHYDDDSVERPGDDDEVVTDDWFGVKTFHSTNPLGNSTIAFQNLHFEFVTLEGKMQLYRFLAWMFGFTTLALSVYVAFLRLEVWDQERREGFLKRRIILSESAAAASSDGGDAAAPTSNYSLQSDTTKKTEITRA